MKKVALFIALLVAATPAHAQTENPGRVLYPFLIAAGIAYVTRRMAIGGWLFYFYLVLFVSSIFTITMAIVSLPNLHPDGWDRFYWVMALLNYIPWLLAHFLVLIFATRLLFKSQRNDKNLRILWYVFLVSVAANLLSAVTGYRYFSDDSLGNIMSVFALISASIWCSYFFLSKRVKYVLASDSGEWDYETFKS